MALIYQPKGKAREYSPWACNLYNGCANRCDYCYNRHSPGAGLLGKDEPTLKAGADFVSFARELLRYKERILADGKGLFFNFVSDPFLPATWMLNGQCARFALRNGVPCVFLSKCSVPDAMVSMLLQFRSLVKVGFTLTGCDGMEPGAATNAQRLTEINALFTAGIQTWASFEPVIDIAKTSDMIQRAYSAGCREFKIGLLSGRKSYTPEQVRTFKETIDEEFGWQCSIYWKDSVKEFINTKK